MENVNQLSLESSILLFKSIQVRDKLKLSNEQFALTRVTKQNDEFYFVRFVRVQILRHCATITLNYNYAR